MGRSAKKEDETKGEGSRNLRLLRGWVHALPYWEEIRSEKGFGRGEEADPQQGIEETLLLQEEIERAQRAVRERIGTSFREESEELGSEGARLWRAIGRLAEELDRLSEKLESLERRRPDQRVRRNRPLAG